METTEKIKKELRKLCNEDPNTTSSNIKTLKDLRVSIIDHSKNPYKTMFEMSTQTWGLPDKWDKATPELRFYVVKKVLERKALPLALEAPNFAFQITNCARAAFDQIARTRIGVVYAARGFKDNNLNYTDLIIPDRIPKYIKDRIKEHYIQTKELYKAMQMSGIPNWANRCVIPMYTSYNFIMSMHFATLSGFCANRMQTTEMEDTVAVAWLMRKEVKKIFPLLGEYLRPACDWSHKDTTESVNGFADVMGIIHESDNRQPGFDKNKFDVRYDEPCADINHIAEELNIVVPKPNEWIEYEWETLSPIDKKLFNE